MILTIKPQVVFEIGLGKPQSCRTNIYWNNNIECFLFDPVTDFCNIVKDFSKNHKNVHVFEYSICDSNDKVEIYNCTEESPSAEGYGKKFVNRSTLDRFDKGNIDMLLVDSEGNEWFAIKHLISRPAIIVLNTHIGNSKNKYIKEIENWMKIHDYICFKTDMSDSHYLRGDLARIAEINTIRVE
jgi:hypothetical protein